MYWSSNLGVYQGANLESVVARSGVELKHQLRAYSDADWGSVVDFGRVIALTRGVLTREWSVYCSAKGQALEH